MSLTSAPWNPLWPGSWRLARGGGERGGYGRWAPHEGCAALGGTTTYEPSTPAGGGRRADIAAGRWGGQAGEGWATTGCSTGVHDLPWCRVGPPRSFIERRPVVYIAVFRARARFVLSFFFRPGRRRRGAGARAASGIAARRTPRTMRKTAGKRKMCAGASARVASVSQSKRSAPPPTHDPTPISHARPGPEHTSVRLQSTQKTRTLRTQTPHYTSDGGPTYATPRTKQ